MNQALVMFPLLSNVFRSFAIRFFFFAFLLLGFEASFLAQALPVENWSARKNGVLTLAQIDGKGPRLILQANFTQDNYCWIERKIVFGPETQGIRFKASSEKVTSLQVNLVLMLKGKEVKYLKIISIKPEESEFTLLLSDFKADGVSFPTNYLPFVKSLMGNVAKKGNEQEKVILSEPEMVTIAQGSSGAGGTPRVDDRLDPPIFEKKAPAREFSELKIYDAKGSPLRAPSEDWTGAAQRVKSDPKWTNWLVTTRSEVDTWMASAHEDVSRVTGRWSRFVSPTDGSFLIFTPEVPGRFLIDATGAQVEVTEKVLGGWTFRFRNLHAVKILEAARLFRLTGETRYADWAAAQLDFYSANYSRFPLQNQNGRSRIMGQGLDEAVNVVQYLAAARLLAPVVSNERIATWKAGLFLPIAELLEGDNQRIHNIACWARSATAQVALFTGDRGLWERSIEGSNGIRQLVARGITSDYLWFEQSMGYNLYVVTAFSHLLRAASFAGRAEELRSEAEILENLMLSPLYLRFPNGRLPNPADSGPPLTVPQRSFLADQADLFPTALGRMERSILTNWNSLLDPWEGPNQMAPLPEVTSRNLESSRMAILREGPWQVYLHYGQLCASHSQAEALNYELAWGDLDLSHDPGTVGYGSPLHHNYYKAGICHNVPLIDGKGQEGWDPGRMVGFEKDRVTASQPKYRSNAEATRTLRIEGGSFSDKVEINSTDNIEHELGTLLHFQGELKNPSDAAEDRAFLESHSSHGFQFIKDVRTVTRSNQTLFEVQIEGRAFEVQISIPGEFQVALMNVPDYPPSRRTALFAFKRGKALVVKTTWTLK